MLHPAEAGSLLNYLNYIEYITMQLNFDDAVEPTIAPAGRYALQITEAKEMVTGPNSKNPGSPMIRVSIGFPQNDEYQNFNHFIMLPTEDDEQKAANNKVLNLKRFLVLFGIPFQNGELDVPGLIMDMTGAQTDGEVKQTEPNANGDVYNSLAVPRIKEDRRY
jgi:hypothetical protein